ncbi:MAG TPA: hypothetical protein VMD91_00425 [Candidatus Sulfotelmatobacter sp.]|nr:hypothetical protein [Candidatus Sulfotelmatobacter sp.]
MLIDAFAACVFGSLWSKRRTLSERQLSAAPPRLSRLNRGVFAMNKTAHHVDSRKSFLIGLGTVALAGCGAGGAQFVPSNRLPASRLHTSGADIVCAPGDCGTGGGVGGSLAGLTIAEIQALTAAEIYGLTPAQIGTVTPTQLAAFTSSQVTSFHGAQASAWLAAIVRAVSGATPPPFLVKPPTYVPAQPGSGFWSWWGGTVGTVVGTAIGGALTANPIGVVVAATIGEGWGQQIFGGAVGATFSFWNSDANDGTGAWNSVDVTVSTGSELNSDGYYLSGDFDAVSDTVTITVIAQ